jgi:hypothetical protein
MSREWKKIRLGNVCQKIGSGATPRGGSEVYQESGISLIRSQNIYNYGFKRDGLAFIGDTHAEELENVTVQPGDVLLNITGDYRSIFDLVRDFMKDEAFNQQDKTLCKYLMMLRFWRGCPALSCIAAKAPRRA